MHHFPTQKELVLAYLRSGRRISAARALTEFRCFRLAAVINRLRNEGHRIESYPQRSFTGQRYVSYGLL